MSKVNNLLKPQVERLYMDGKTPSEIMSVFPHLPESTLYNWIKKGRWNEIRENKIVKYTKTPEIMLDMLAKLIDEVPAIFASEETPTSEKANKIAKISDSISKICKSIKSLSRDQDRLGSIIFTIGELGKCMNQCPYSHIFDEEFRTKFDKLLEAFQKQSLEKYSPKNMG